MHQQYFSMNPPFFLPKLYKALSFQYMTYSAEHRSLEHTVRFSSVSQFFEGLKWLISYLKESWRTRIRIITIYQVHVMCWVFRYITNFYNNLLERGLLSVPYHQWGNSGSRAQSKQPNFIYAVLILYMAHNLSTYILFQYFLIYFHKSPVRTQMPSWDYSRVK